jgi:hypothetical protein
MGLALAGSLSTGCKKSSSAATAPTTMSATLADSSYQTSGEWNGVSYEPQDTGFIITGQVPGGGTALQLFFNEPFTLNVPISTVATSAIVSFEINTVDPTYVYEARGCCNGHAIITVTAWDPGQRTIAGTFSGVLYGGVGDTLVVTNGVFNASYPSN